MEKRKTIQSHLSSSSVRGSLQITLQMGANVFQKLFIPFLCPWKLPCARSSFAHPSDLVVVLGFSNKSSKMIIRGREHGPELKNLSSEWYDRFCSWCSEGWQLHRPLIARCNVHCSLSRDKIPKDIAALHSSLKYHL